MGQEGIAAKKSARQCVEAANGRSLKRSRLGATAASRLVKNECFVIRKDKTKIGREAGSALVCVEAADASLFKRSILGKVLLQHPDL